MKCDCGYEWVTKSKMKYVSCPSCLRKVLNSSFKQVREEVDGNV